MRHVYGFRRAGSFFDTWYQLCEPKKDMVTGRGVYLPDQELVDNEGKKRSKESQLVSCPNCLIHLFITSPKLRKLFVRLKDDTRCTS